MTARGNLRADSATVCELYSHLSVLPFSPHAMSLYIDMKMILSLKCSGSHCSVFESSRGGPTSWFLGILSTRTPYGIPSIRSKTKEKLETLSKYLKRSNFKVQRWFLRYEIPCEFKLLVWSAVKRKGKFPKLHVPSSILCVFLKLRYTLCHDHSFSVFDFVEVFFKKKNSCHFF